MPVYIWAEYVELFGLGRWRTEARQETNFPYKEAYNLTVSILRIKKLADFAR